MKDTKSTQTDLGILTQLNADYLAWIRMATCNVTGKYWLRTSCPPCLTFCCATRNNSWR